MEFHFQFDGLKIVLSGVVICFCGLFVYLHNELVLKPQRLRNLLTEQGIKGPPPALLLGNIADMKAAVEINKPNPAHQQPISHNIAASISPYLEQWKKQYGDPFVFSLGNKQVLYISQPEVMKEIVICTSLDIGKPSYQQKEYDPLIGHGIINSNGKSWAWQRKILGPEFYIDKVKGMMSLITESTNILMKPWKSRVEEGGGITDINIYEYMKKFSGDVISRACFGSNFSRGEQIFRKLKAIGETIPQNRLLANIPGMSYLPTRTNRQAWKLKKEVRDLILKVVKERQETAHEKDLLQMILDTAKDNDLNQEATDHFIVDNCKNIYVAGHDTTSCSSTWCLMLLASHQEWQDRVRAEVLQVCRGRSPTPDMLPKLKLLTMVINETLRLYPPAPMVSREAFKDMKFGNIKVPKGVNIWFSVLAFQTDPEIWGPDAYKFRPDRFANGISGACKYPHLYMPFGFGPRQCVGINLALVELKILIALLLSNFSLSLSPNYIHSPVYRLHLEPEHGVNLLIRKL